MLSTFNSAVATCSRADLDTMDHHDENCLYTWVWDGFYIIDISQFLAVMHIYSYSDAFILQTIYSVLSTLIHADCNFFIIAGYVHQ